MSLDAKLKEKEDELKEKDFRAWQHDRFFKNRLPQIEKRLIILWGITIGSFVLAVIILLVTGLLFF